MKIAKNNVFLVFIIILVSVLILAISTYFIIKSKNNGNGGKEVLLKESEALNIGDELWKYAMSAHWGGSIAWTKEKTGNVDKYGIEETRCTATKESIKERFTDDFTGKNCYYFENKEECKSEFGFDSFIIIEDCIEPGVGSIQTYAETSLKVKEITSNKITFIATSTYCDGYYCEDESNPKGNNKLENEFIIQKINDSWKIKYFVLPN